MRDKSGNKALRESCWVECFLMLMTKMMCPSNVSLVNKQVDRQTSQPDRKTVDLAWSFSRKAFRGTSYNIGNSSHEFQRTSYNKYTLDEIVFPYNPVLLLREYKWNMSLRIRESKDSTKYFPNRRDRINLHMKGAHSVSCSPTLSPCFPNLSCLSQHFPPLQL